MAMTEKSNNSQPSTLLYLGAAGTVAAGACALWKWRKGSQVAHCSSTCISYYVASPQGYEHSFTSAGLQEEQDLLTSQLEKARERLRDEEQRLAHENSRLRAGMQALQISFYAFAAHIFLLTVP